ncbi:protein ABIL1-like, partial [Trifolium medium]|nr:protein ABIL1-like [Trifolium medium]
VLAAAMTFDEVSMERSKTFIFSLQELKNLRPQLYSAAEYCEKSFLRSDHKEMKDVRFVMRFLVCCCRRRSYPLHDLFLVKD